MESLKQSLLKHNRTIQDFSATSVGGLLYIPVLVWYIGSLTGIDTGIKFQTNLISNVKYLV